MGERGVGTTRDNFSRRMGSGFPDDGRQPFQQLESVEIESETKFVPVILSGFRKEEQPVQYNFNFFNDAISGRQPPSLCDDDPPHPMRDGKLLQCLKNYETRARKFSGCARIPLASPYNSLSSHLPENSPKWPCCKFEKREGIRTRKYLKVKKICT